jgi:phospholipid-binding lipoprotein MlaA
MPLFKCVISSVLLLLLSGCAHQNPHPHDPLESINREIYGFNRAVDKGLLRPVAYFYRTHLPREVQGGAHNFFGHLSLLPTIANDLLQFKIAYALHDSSRFLINSTLGVAGFFDPATQLGLVSRQEDFGQTLYHWGVTESIYLVVPLLGPSTLRDTLGTVVDTTCFSAWPYLSSDLSYPLYGLDMVDKRAHLLKNEKLLESMGIDEYAFVRNAYLQGRNFVGLDGSQKDTELDPFADTNWHD